MTDSPFAAVVLSVVSLVFPNVADAVTYKVTLLHPIGFIQSFADGVSGTSQVGSGYGVATGGITTPCSGMARRLASWT